MYHFPFTKAAPNSHVLLRYSYDEEDDETLDNTAALDMGCRLPKLRKAEERRSPGNIYSTLRRPQVETKVGVAYTYHFLDFLLGKEGEKKDGPYTEIL
ncbi:Raftlin [Liparis tanakae]|uniref:Raftlin n=1 Tax=Liparis tanakae TaxID=230148 RepID=A0A4Z2JDR6_9TELE|nr:Raftlin [Liparis tanakae]